jgi:hypothetical protein
MDSMTKKIVVATGIIVVAVSTHIVANALYTNTKIGVHKKAVIVAGGIGIISTFALLSIIKKSS